MSCLVSLADCCGILPFKERLCVSGLASNKSWSPKKFQSVRKRALERFRKRPYALALYSFTVRSLVQQEGIHEGGLKLDAWQHWLCQLLM